MRKINAIAEFDEHKRKTLLDNFKRAVAAQSALSAQNLFKEAAEAPAPRFWVSETRATTVIRKMRNGMNVTAGMIPQKRAMYDEIYRRYCELRAAEPEAPLSALVFEVVNQEAPESYMSWQRAKNIINEELRRIRAERRARK